MGHYDECRDGYCGICGQTNGNCEHTRIKRGTRREVPGLIDQRMEDQAREDIEEAIEFISHFSPIKPRFTAEEVEAMDFMCRYYSYERSNDEKFVYIPKLTTCVEIIQKMLEENGGYV